MVVCLARVGEVCWLDCFGDAGSGWLFASDLLIVGLIRFDLGFGVGIVNFCIVCWVLGGWRCCFVF